MQQTPEESAPRHGPEAGAPTGTAWGEFVTARARFFDRLAAQSEIARLERAWSLAEPAGSRRRRDAPPPAPPRRSAAGRGAG